MRFHDPQRYEILAGEYVLGTLSGRARDRFTHYLKMYPFLRRAVDDWERHFNAVVEDLEPVEPPPMVWEQICEELPELRRRFLPRSLWGSLRLWRPLALLASAIALFLLVYIGNGFRQPGFPPLPTHVAMINDPKTQQPAWMLSLMSRDKMLKVTAMHPPSIPADKSCELWMLPGKDRPPISLGLLPMQGTMMMPLSKEKLGVLSAAAGLAVSMEPKGGSPTGAPTGPVMYQGALYPI